MNLILALKISGIILVFLGLIHAVFPTYFKWKEELKSLSLINKQIMEVHTFFLAVILVLMGLLAWFFPEELCTTSLGQAISCGLAIFWGLRLYFQFFVYSSVLWRGKPFETTIHILFSIIWTGYTTLFALSFFNGFGK